MIGSSPAAAAATLRNRLGGLLLGRRAAGRTAASTPTRRFTPAAPSFLSCRPRRSHYTHASPGSFGEDRHHHDHDHNNNSNSNSNSSTPPRRDYRQRGFTVGIGGPVGSGKTALVLELCRALNVIHLGVVTNDIFTQEDAEFLVRRGALPPDRIRAVETGGCPHAAIREDVSGNLRALEELTATASAAAATTAGSSGGDTSTAAAAWPPLLLCESGGDNLAANFSRELADLTVYVIDVAGGDKVPRKGGPGITQSDLLVINKVDLAGAVGADLRVMERDARRMRMRRRSAGRGDSSNDDDPPASSGPTIFAAVKHGKGVPEICDFILKHYRAAMATLEGDDDDDDNGNAKAK